MDFKEQVTNVKIVTITKPRTYILWNNTENGRDKIESYERIDDGYVVYVNIHNRNTTILFGDKFFDVLEDMYQNTIINKEKDEEIFASEILMDNGVIASDEAISSVIEYAKLKCKEQRIICSECSSDGLSDYQYNDILNAHEPNFL